MSDIVLLGVLRMPRELRETDEIGRLQFDAMVLEAADEIERLRDRELQADRLFMALNNIEAHDWNNGCGCCASVHLDESIEWQEVLKALAEYTGNKPGKEKKQK